MRIKHEESESMKTLIEAIKKQFFLQRKVQFSENLQKASLLMRIIPLSVFSRFIKWQMRGELASFSFSCVDKPQFEYDSLFGCRVNNLFHMPRVPTPPGIGVFFTRFRGAINITLSYLDGLISDEDAQRIIDTLRRYIDKDSAHEAKI